MPQSPPRVAVVTFDAASKSFSLNPDPIRIPPGRSDLYFALQTANRGDAARAEFRTIFEDHLFATASSVEGSNELWKVVVDNESPSAGEESYSYTVRISYAGKEYPYDPSVVLEPPPTEPPA